MLDYILIILAVILLAGNFAITKLFQLKAGAGIVASLVFNAITGIFTVVLMWSINGFRIEITGFSLLMAFLMKMSVTLYTLIGFRMMAGGQMMVYTMFLMAGGMTVPYVWGIFALGEKFSLLRLLGLVLIIAGVIFSNYSKEKLSWRYICMGVAVFFLNGITSVTSKLHQIETRAATVNDYSFVALTGAVGFVFCGLMLLFVRKKNATLKKIPWKAGVLIGLGSALLSGVSFLFQLIGASNLPATVLYPMITGGAVVFTALAARLFFREKLTKPMMLGLVFCFAGTCCFL